MAEAERVVAAIRQRYDGNKRNPFDEAECGHHYARAMISWGLINAWSGFDYDARRQNQHPVILMRSGHQLLHVVGGGASKGGDGARGGDQPVVEVALHAGDSVGMGSAVWADGEVVHFPWVFCEVVEFDKSVGVLVGEHVFGIDDQAPVIAANAF